MTRGSLGCTAKPNTDLPPWYPFHNLPRAQFLPPSALRQRPMPNVPTQMVKFFPMVRYTSFARSNSKLLYLTSENFHTVDGIRSFSPHDRRERITRRPLLTGRFFLALKSW